MKPNSLSEIPGSFLLHVSVRADAQTTTQPFSFSFHQLSGVRRRLDHQCTTSSPDQPLIAHPCNGAKFKGNLPGFSVSTRIIKGDPTNTAILRFAQESIISFDAQRHRCVGYSFVSWQETTWSSLQRPTEIPFWLTTLKSFFLGLLRNTSRLLWNKRRRGTIILSLL